MDRHLRLEHLAKMPTDGLALAVFVRRQIEVLGLLQGGLQFLHLLGLLGRNDVDRLKSMIDVHAQVGPIFLLQLHRHFLGPIGQIADMTDAGLNHVAAAEKLADRAGFSWRFDNNQRRGVGIGRFLDMVIWIICKKMITMGFRSGLGFLSYDTLVVYLCNCSLAV